MTREQALLLRPGDTVRVVKPREDLRIPKGRVSIVRAVRTDPGDPQVMVLCDESPCYFPDEIKKVVPK